MGQTRFQVSTNPGSYSAPQLKYLTPSTSGVLSLKASIASLVRLSNALPSPPPFGRNSRRARTAGR